MVRAVGAMNKVGGLDDEWFYMMREFGPRVILKFGVHKPATCERVLVRQETLPAEPERQETIPAKPERTVQVYRWECPPSILAAKPREATNGV
jgi:hypothetical protein